MKQSYFKLSFDRIVKIYLWGRRNCYWLRLAPRAYFIRTKISVCIYKISIDDGTTFSGISGKGATPNLWKLLFENNRSVWFSEFLEFFLACFTFWNFNHVNNLDFPGNYFTICRRVEISGIFGSMKCAPNFWGRQQDSLTETESPVSLPLREKRKAEEPVTNHWTRHGVQGLFFSCIFDCNIVNFA